MDSGSYRSKYLPGGVKGWCGSGKEHQRKKRIVGALVQEGHGLVGDPGGRVHVLGHRRTPHLLRQRLVRQGVHRPLQLLGVDSLRHQPAEVVPGTVVGVVRRETDVVEAVEVGRQNHVLHLVALIELPLVPAFGVGRCDGVEVGCVLERLACYVLVVTHVLEVTLAHEPGAVAAVAQGTHERLRSPGEWHPVEPCAVYGRHAARGDGGAVRHADGVRHHRAVEARAARCDAVEVRRLHDLVAAEARVVGAMLVGDEEQKRGSGHDELLVGSLGVRSSTRPRSRGGRSPRPR